LEKSMKTFRISSVSCKEPSCWHQPPKRLPKSYWKVCFPPLGRNCGIMDPSTRVPGSVTCARRVSLCAAGSKESNQIRFCRAQSTWVI
jgi:hypothetical protein